MIRIYLFQHKLDPKTIDYYTKKLEDVAMQASSREKASENAERAVNKLKSAELMSYYIVDHPDDLLQCEVIDVKPEGLYVFVDGLNVEGLVPIKTLGDDYVFSEDYCCIISKGSKTRYNHGTRLLVKCTRASKEDKQIDFKLVKDLRLENDSNTVEKDAKKLTLTNGRNQE